MTAAFIAEAIWPDGLGTTVIRLSAAASSRAMASVRSLDGPDGEDQLEPARVILAEDGGDRLGQVLLLVEHRHDDGDGGKRRLAPQASNGPPGESADPFWMTVLILCMTPVTDAV